MMNVSKSLTIPLFFLHLICFSQKANRKNLTNKTWILDHQPKDIKSLFSEDTIKLYSATSNSQLIFMENGSFHFSFDSKQKLFDNKTKECDLKKGCGQWRYNNTKELIGFWLYDYDTTSGNKLKQWTDVTTYYYKIQESTDFSLVLVKQTGKLKGHVNVRSTADTGIVREHLMIWLKLNDGTFYITGIDKNFEFSYNDLQADTTEIRLTTIDKYKDTIVSNVIINDHKTTQVEISYPPFCDFDKSKNDSLCPVCHKHDQVTLIIYEPYANPPKGKRKRLKYWGEHNFLTGCDPHWYCRRDDKKF